MFLIVNEIKETLQMLMSPQAVYITHLSFLDIILQMLSCQITCLEHIL